MSELVELKSVHVSLEQGALHATGKGSKERVVPFGEEAHSWIRRYLVEARAEILKGQSSNDLFVTARGDGMTRQMFWIIVKKHATAAGITVPLSPPHPAPRLRHPPAQSRRRPPRRPAAPRPLRHLDPPRSTPTSPENASAYSTRLTTRAARGLMRPSQARPGTASRMRAARSRASALKSTYAFDTALACAPIAPSAARSVKIGLRASWPSGIKLL